MSSLGLYLRGLREAKGMSLDDIARSTRVGRRHLEALETDTMGELPAPVFVKGFIRAYCEFLDAAPDEALSLYREVTGEPAPSDGTVRPLQTSRSRLPGPFAITVVLLLALGASLLALRLGLPSARKAAVPVEPMAVEEVGKVTPSAPAPAKAVTSAPASQASSMAPSGPSPVPAAAVTAPSSSPPLPADPPATVAPAPSAAEAKALNHRLVIRAVEPTWLRVQVDDGQVSEELLPSGAVREWSASRRFTLTVGNAGGVEIDLDGKRVPPLGAKGVVIQRLVLPQETSGAGS